MPHTPHLCGLLVEGVEAHEVSSSHHTISLVETHHAQLICLFIYLCCFLLQALLLLAQPLSCQHLLSQLGLSLLSKLSNDALVALNKQRVLLVPPAGIAGSNTKGACPCCQSCWFAIQR
jgi:hypothetical protein